jgi:hypothetical protein
MGLMEDGLSTQPRWPDSRYDDDVDVDVDVDVDKLIFDAVPII